MHHVIWYQWYVEGGYNFVLPPVGGDQQCMPENGGVHCLMQSNLPGFGFLLTRSSFPREVKIQKIAL